MDVRTLAHLSDLHLGRSVEVERRAIALCDSLLAADVDHVVVTGDLTHRGRQRELKLFWKIFAPLAERNKLTVIPGNHDRLGDDLGESIQPGSRVSVVRAPGLYLVRFDSTGPHNRSWIAGHGVMTASDVVEIAGAVDAAPPGQLVAVLLHHHVLPLPADHAAERLVSWLGWPFAEELGHGEALLETLRGRCDLVLHGHRHTPRSTTLDPDEQRPLAIYNAGSSTELGRVRVFWHRAGQLMNDPAWLSSYPTGLDLGGLVQPNSGAETHQVARRCLPLPLGAGI